MSGHRYHYRPPPANHPLLKTARSLAVTPGTVLPSLVDQRPVCLPIRNQLQEGCCSGFATGALRESLHCLAAGALLGEPLSPAYLYARTRMLEGTFPNDVGATLADEMTTLVNYGVCPESVLPYSGNAAEGPTPAADVAAVPFRIAAAVRVGFGSMNSIDAVRYALAVAGTPVVFGMAISASFETTGSDGLVPLPGPAEVDKPLGGHAMLCVGYDDTKQRLIVRNSWGESFGDKGYFYIPYALVPTFYEAWTASPCP